MLAFANRDENSADLGVAIASRSETAAQERPVSTTELGNFHLSIGRVETYLLGANLLLWKAVG